MHAGTKTENNTLSMLSDITPVSILNFLPIANIYPILLKYEPISKREILEHLNFKLHKSIDLKSDIKSPYKQENVQICQ